MIVQAKFDSEGILIIPKNNNFHSFTAGTAILQEVSFNEDVINGEALETPEKCITPKKQVREWPEAIFDGSNFVDRRTKRPITNAKFVYLYGRRMRYMTA